MMRRFPSVLLLALLLASAPVLGGSGIAWYKTDFAKALADAKGKKPVAIDFFAVWCGPCKMMDKKTFPDEGVKKAAAGFVMLKVDAEKGEGVDLAKQFRIANYPTMVFLAKDGGELNRFIGYREPSELLESMKLTVEGKSRLALQESRLKASPDDIDLLKEVARGYVIRADGDKASPYLDRMAKVDPGNEQGLFEEALTARADLLRRDKKYAEAAKILDDLLGKGVPIKSEERVLHDLGVYHARAKAPEASLAAFRKLIKKYPGKNSLNAMAWEFSQRGMNLDAAEEAAKAALKEAGDDAGIMDTLAEVYFAQGSYDLAIDLAKKEISLDPDDAYFRRQLEKYESAKGKQGSVEAP